MAKKSHGEKIPHSVMSYYHYRSIGDFGSSKRLRGPYRVILFCLLTILTPILLLVTPLYIRYHAFGPATYFVGESDLVTIDRQVSTFWCEGQDLRMNATFHAYLLSDQPENSEDLQKVELDKHMKLADDSLEYWGFYLLGGSKVTLSVCSRFGGARLMVVKGTRSLKHCALIEPPNDDIDEPWEDDVSAQKGEKIEVTFEGGDHQHPTNMGSEQKSEQGQEQVATTTTTSTTTTTTSTTPAPTKVLDVATAKPPKTYRLNRGKKNYTPSGSPSIPPEGRDLNQEIHENLKVRRHKQTHALPKNSKRRRRRRFIETEPDRSEFDLWPEEHLGRNSLRESNEADETEGDIDEPPHPVGIEPAVMSNRPSYNTNHQNDPNRHNNNNNNNHLDEVIDESDIRSSGASFAKNLWTCYGEDTVFTQTFSPSQRCQSQDALYKNALRMRTVHEIASSGYYYYIFYSDNDIVLNDIFAKFTIEKVVYNFPNVSSCKNVTMCNLNLTFLSSEKVLLEIPLQDGVTSDDITQMVLESTCRPRLGVYFIFPVLILLCILCCAFI